MNGFRFAMPVRKGFAFGGQARREPDRQNWSKAEPMINQFIFPLEVLKPEEINLIFNHLPVDITYVDKDDIVKYFPGPPREYLPGLNHYRPQGKTAILQPVSTLWRKSWTILSKVERTVSHSG